MCPVGAEIKCVWLSQQDNHAIWLAPNHPRVAAPPYPINDYLDQLEYNEIIKIDQIND